MAADSGAGRPLHSAGGQAPANFLERTSAEPEAASKSESLCAQAPLPGYSSLIAAKPRRDVQPYERAIHNAIAAGL